MGKSALHNIGLAEEHLGKLRFRQCLRVLGEIDVESISPDEGALYNLIWAEAQLALGNSNIETSVQSALEFYRTSNDDERFARAKYLYGCYLISVGRFFDAKEPLLEALVSLKRVQVPARQGQILNKLGFISYHVGEFDSAIAYLQQCIKTYHQNDDSSNALMVSLNLGQLNMSLGRLTESIQVFEEYASGVSIKSEKNKATFEIMCAMPFALRGNVSEAVRMIKKAKEYLDGLVREKAVYYEYLGWIHNLEGDYDEALKTLRRGLDISLEIAPESSLVSQTKRLMADAFLGLGEFETARIFADDALAVAKTLNERVEIAACYRVYAQLEAFAGNENSTKEWFAKATEMFSTIGSNYELAVTRYLAATSGYYLNGERHALLYLAREYFESENVEHYVTKINRELKETPMMRSQPAHSNNTVPTIICRDSSMVRLVELAERIAPSNMSVLLTGPTGCGKDLFARYIHHHSGRTGRFVSVNAAAIPDNMIESELFGYHKGAYTGASTTTAGWIEEANNGTFYLNEIADSSPELQAKLLDVIENRRICRLGERQEREIDCRIIAATNHDLEKLVASGRFRLDLFHRLNEIPIDLPGLSDRGGDIASLLEYFLKQADVEITTKADRAAFDRLASIFASRPWPGNVRELEIKVKRLTLLSHGDIARMVDLAIGELPSKKDETQAALDRTGWNRREVARMLGISESTVRHRIKIFNLSPTKSE
jgi:two-component system NtrC family response regulator